MKIFPAIDLKNAQVVRLTQGDYDQVEVYSNSPLEIAKKFTEKGAQNLHIVDLDGARDGELSNFSVIAQMIKETGLSVQVGGGIRDEKRIQSYVELGVERVILGTVAAENPEFVAKMVQKYGDHIAVGVDAKDGKVAVSGWEKVTDLDSLTFCKELETMGVTTIIYTDISKDGMLSGINTEVYEQLAQAVGCNIIASGGVSSTRDLEILANINTYGAIVGKALYTNKLTLEEVLKYEK